MWAGSRKGSGVWGALPENARSWARPRQRARAIRGMVPTGGTHGSARTDERTGFCADERGPRNRESERACMEETCADRSTPPGSERERGERVRAGWLDRRGPPIRGRADARARDLDGPRWAGWAELAFSFFLEFLMVFLFIFSRVSKSNENSNYFKHVHQTKE
jgi:hypothetical protein